MNWLIDTLRRLASWLESRRTPTNYVSQADLTPLIQRLALVEANAAVVMARHEEELNKLKGEIQKLSLHAGFTRSTQASPRR